MEEEKSLEQPHAGKFVETVTTDGTYQKPDLITDLKARLAASEAEMMESARTYQNTILDLDGKLLALETKLAASEAAAGEMRAALTAMLDCYEPVTISAPILANTVGKQRLRAHGKAKQALSSEAGKKALAVIEAAEKLVEKYESNPLRNINPPLNWGPLIAALDRFHGRTPEGGA